MVIPAEAIIADKELVTGQVDLPFFNKFKTNDSFYPKEVPLALATKKDYDLYKIANSELHFIDKWPSVLDNNHFVENKKGFLHRATDVFGPGVRTSLEIQDLERWVVFWGLVDIIVDSGCYAWNIDSRVPGRNMFLREYDLLCQSHQDLDPVELELEINRKLQRNYRPIEYVRSELENWINQYPDNLYNVYFRGSSIFVDRLSNIATFYYHASKEKSLLLGRLESLQN